MENCLQIIKNNQKKFFKKNQKISKLWNKWERESEKTRKNVRSTANGIHVSTRMGYAVRFKNRKVVSMIRLLSFSFLIAFPSQFCMLCVCVCMRFWSIKYRNVDDEHTHAHARALSRYRYGYVYDFRGDIGRARALTLTLLSFTRNVKSLA